METVSQIISTIAAGIVSNPLLVNDQADTMTDQQVADMALNIFALINENIMEVYGEQEDEEEYEIEIQEGEDTEE